MLRPIKFEVQAPLDLIAACKTMRQIAREQLGASQMGATLAATVVSELARNILQHVGGGSLTIAACRGRLVIETHDCGPGIADIELALSPGYSTIGGLGLGLTGIARVAEQLQVVNEDPCGLRVRCVLVVGTLGGPRRTHRTADPAFPRANTP